MLCGAAIPPSARVCRLMSWCHPGHRSSPCRPLSMLRLGFFQDEPLRGARLSLLVLTSVRTNCAGAAVALAAGAMSAKYIRDSNSVRVRQMWALRRAMTKASSYEEWNRDARQLDQLIRDHPACVAIRT